MRATPWRRLLVYAACLGPLQSEEAMVWLTIQHSADPKALHRKLQIAAQTPTATRSQPEQVIQEWALNPFLREGIEYVENLS